MWFITGSHCTHVCKAAAGSDKRLGMSQGWAGLLTVSASRQEREQCCLRLHSSRRLPAGDCGDDEAEAGCSEGCARPQTL